jgi:wyosine [tRNA(Phe)-imidazoG37] synthetase (radical SAM superfamily)
LFYGPVLSRRFGYSLGVDLIPLKVCVYDCIYCQLGRTTYKTVERKSYVDINFKGFENELKKRIKNCPYLDYVTFSGSGEPTLNSDIGRLIKIVKENSSVPVAVLTSGGTLGFSGVIDDIKESDLIKVSLDAPDDRMLKRINRPAREVNFDINISGLTELINNFSGDIWLEIMVMKGINDDLDSAYMFKEIIDRLGEIVKKVHLNTPVRSLDKYSGRYYAEVPEPERLKEIKDIIGNKALLIEDVSRKKYDSSLVEIEKEIVEVLGRRPMEIRDIASSLGLNLNEVIKIVNKLLSSGEIERTAHGDIEYYFKTEN